MPEAPAAARRSLLNPWMLCLGSLLLSVSVLVPAHVSAAGTISELQHIRRYGLPGTALGWIVPFLFLAPLWVSLGAATLAGLLLSRRGLAAGSWPARTLSRLLVLGFHAGVPIGVWARVSFTFFPVEPPMTRWAGLLLPVFVGHYLGSIWAMRRLTAGRLAERPRQCVAGIGASGGLVAQWFAALPLYSLEPERLWPCWLVAAIGLALQASTLIALRRP